MQFQLVEDSPDSALHEKSLQARNELIGKILDCWPRLAEIQLWVLPNGSTYERLPQSIDCDIDDQDRYTPHIDDPHIAGDEALLKQSIEEVQRERAQVAKQIADTAIQACREAIDRITKARSFRIGVMGYAQNGTLEQVAEQKLSVAVIGELPQLSRDEPSADTDASGSVVDRLAATIERLTANADAAAEQLRQEKSDLHLRLLEVIDKNIGFVDKFKDLVQQTMNHVQLPPEHYVLEGEKARMRADSQHAAMAENTKAAMAADRQETLRQFSRDNPNAVENIVEAALTIVEEARKADSSPREPKEHAAGNTDAQSEEQQHASPSPPPQDAGPSPEQPPPEPTPTFCRGTTRLRRFIDDDAIEKLKTNMLPDGWGVLEPLLVCTDEAQFRRQINAISAALSQMDKQAQEAFRNALKASIPGSAQLRLVNFLGAYGVRVV